MPELTPAQKVQILGELKDLDWMRELYRVSAQLISERIGVSTDEGTAILEQLENEGVIEAVNESGGRPAYNRTLDSYGWRWLVKE